MPIEYATGNLLAAPVDALVNTVNCEGVMGKGIALQFKQAWPTMFEAYRQECRTGEMRPGHIGVWYTGRHLPRIILNFPTKRNWRDGSRLADIDDALARLPRLIREYGIISVAIPPLGCGNGGLDWSVVRPRIVETLKDVNARVIIYGASS